MEPVDFEGLLKEKMGLDAATIGSAAVDRAVRIRMASHALKRREDYWRRLLYSDAELQELVELVVVPETWFFRDRGAYTALVRLVLRDWLPSHPAGVLRLLSVPCSTGEEPYSMIMALLDAGLSWSQLHVDAVDISLWALTRAKRGVYGGNSFRRGDLSFRDRYFRPSGDSYALAEWIPGKVNFRQTNVLDAEVRFGQERYDIIFCRNLLIYFDRPTQERVMQTLERFLEPDGFLFVGAAEAFLASSNGFTSVNHAMSFAFRSPSASRPITGETVRRRRRAVVTAAGPDKQLSVAESDPLIPAAAARGGLEHARSLADAGFLREAADQCESYLRQQGASCEAYYLLGLTRDALGDRRSAAECYRRAVYLEPEHMEALLHLSFLMETLGDSAAAGRFRERARRAGKEPGD